MIESVKRVMKICAIGGILHYGLNFVYDFGKARMFGAIASENAEVMEMLQDLSNYKPEHLSDRLKMSFITSVALQKAKKEETP